MQCLRNSYPKNKKQKTTKLYFSGSEDPTFEIYCNDIIHIPLTFQKTNNSTYNS